TGLSGFDDVDIADAGAARVALAQPTPDRLLTIAQAFRLDLTVEGVAAACRYDPWFLRDIEKIVAAELGDRPPGQPPHADGFLRLKQLGFSYARLGALTNLSEGAVAEQGRALGLRPVFKRIDTCAGEFASSSSYMYSCYAPDPELPGACEAEPSDRRKVMIL